MVKIEEGKNGPKTEAYLDLKGLMTIGVGFNIAENKALRDAVLDAILPTDDKLGNDADAIRERGELKTKLAVFITKSRPSTFTDAELKAVRKELDRLVTPSEWTATEKDKYPTLLEFGGQMPDKFDLTLPEIRDIFNNVAAPAFETIVSDYIGYYNLENNFDITDNERIALFSLAYNNPKLLGSGLGTAIENGNRAEAWFQIRYYSNGGNTPSDGIAKRRYYESEIFGVFANESSPTVDESKDFYRTLQAHASRITKYEAAYGHMISKANFDYRASVDTLDSITNSALNKLKLEFGQGVNIQHVVVGSNSINDAFQ